MVLRFSEQQWQSIPENLREEVIAVSRILFTKGFLATPQFILEHINNRKEADQNYTLLIQAATAAHVKISFK